MPEIVPTDLARDYFEALVGNVMAHHDSAARLLPDDRPGDDDGHARQHAVLARVELTRLQVLYDLCADAWTQERPTVELSDELLALERSGPALPAALLLVERGADEVRHPYQEDATVTRGQLREVLVGLDEVVMADLHRGGPDPMRRAYPPMLGVATQLTMALRSRPQILLFPEDT